MFTLISVHILPLFLEDELHYVSKTNFFTTKLMLRFRYNFGQPFGPSILTWREAQVHLFPPSSFVNELFDIEVLVIDVFGLFIML